MQCPLNSLCFLSPKIIFFGLACSGLALGLGSVVRPARSIALYQWIMKRMNWNVAPIDELREVRNTRILGVILVAISLALFFTTFSRF